MLPEGEPQRHEEPEGSAVVKSPTFPAPATDDAQRGLPERFDVSEPDYALYEGIDYEEYWDAPNRTRQDALEQRLVADMLPTRGRRIIDVGCGYGRLAPCYVDRFDQVVLYDGSLSLLRQARRALGDRAVLVAGDVGRLPFKAASFDLVLTIRVLQHVHDLAPTIGGMRRILADGGRLLFSYHNKRNANRVLHYARSRKVGDPFSLESAEVSPTLISHHPLRMAEMLKEAGFGEPEYKGALVLDPLARFTEQFGQGSPSGLLWASFTGKYKLAPWLIGQSPAVVAEPLAEGTSVEDLFECPSCRGGIERSSESFDCTACGASYPARDGIADFRL